MVLDAQPLETYLRVVILSDGKAGHLNQSIAFAKLKGLDYDVIDIHNNIKALTYLLDFFHIYINLFALHVEQKKYKAVVSAGSGTYYANKFLSRKLKIKSIAIMTPKGFRLSDFDYIIALEHDYLKPTGNTIILPVSLSICEPKGYFKNRNKPSIGIILGGENSVFKMDTESIKEILDKIYKDHPNHLKYITTSRRTPKEIEKLLDNYEFDYKVIYSKNPTINPIPDFLDVCDELYISIDSASMLSEARANSDANIHIINLNSKEKDTKYHRLAENIRKINGKFNYKPYLDKIEL